MGENRRIIDHMKQYFGPQTSQALENFPFTLPSVSLDLIYAITEIKKASAIAHRAIGELDNSVAEAIVSACNEILAGKFDDQFPVSSLQGGAGTSINMNVNEVIASRASEIAGKEIHPNDHVNKSQSTNDVNPTALRVVTIRHLNILTKELTELTKSIESKINEYGHVKKLARTHMQDAIPTTVGDEMGAWKATIERDVKRLSELTPYLLQVHLGGTAIGNGMNASIAFQKEIVVQLNKVLVDIDSDFTPASNFHSFTSTASDFVHVSALLTLLASDLSKIAHDIRFLSSGPRGGIGEYCLAPLQPGSSIMPGKVNPVIPELMNQIYYQVSGKHLAIQMANETSDLQLAVMFPTVADSLIFSLGTLIAGVGQFRAKCFDLLEIDQMRCQYHLENSTAYATLLTPILGYDVVSACVKEAVKTGKSVKEIVLERKLLTEQEIESG